MTDNANSSIFSKWTDELNATLLKNDSFCVAIFSTDKELLFANDAMSALFKGEPSGSFINPTFEKLLLLDNTNPLIFDGFLTLGDYTSVNASISVQIYRKGDSLLIVGGVNAWQLMQQNETMHQLNSEISNLQRQLIREKHTLEEASKQLQQTNNELNEVNATKNKFFNIIAHDLKNPFVSILGFSNLLLNNIDKYEQDKIKQFVTNINKSAKNTSDLLENLLEWSRTQQNTMPFEPEENNLYALAFESYMLTSQNAQNKLIEIELNIPKDIEIEADSQMLSTIIRNLLSNAIKFTSENGKITITGKQANNGSIILKIADTGIGMDEQTKNTLFKIDKTTSKAGTKGEKGTGFGLLLCKEFVDKHNGTIHVESEVGKGSKFIVTLPLKQTNPQNS